MVKTESSKITEARERERTEKIYSKLAITEAQKEYNEVIGQFPV